jgi:type II secretory ATPase GspE/PulE/Tfp pilus assembly ATPase PilB-like protein
MNNSVKEERGTELIRELIMEALAEKAGDIHLEPQKDGGFIVKYRINEGLKEVKSFASDVTEKLIFQLKKMAGMNDESTIVQKGNFFMETEGNELSIRVGTLPLPLGERIVLSVNKGEKTCTDGGFNVPDFQQEDLESMKEIFDKPSGIVFITGTAGSGHRETCYSALNYILARKSGKVNIITLEGSTEYMINGIVQLHINDSNEYYETLKSVIWQDPDVVFIDNVPDRNTGRIISDIALTGHMVIIRMNSYDIFYGIKTLKKLGFEPCLMASTLEGAIAQRMVRTICKNCMEEYSPKEDIAERYYLRLYQRCLQSRNKTSSGEENVSNPLNKVSLYRGKGCKECNHTGYRGQTGLYEILNPDMEMKDLFARKLNFKEFKERLMGKDFVTLREKALFYALSGVTTLEEALKVSYSS